MGSERRVLRPLEAWIEQAEPTSPIKALGDSRFLAWLNLIHAHAAIAEELDRRMQARSIGSLLTNQVLGRLANDARRHRVVDLSRQLLVEKSRISRLIDRLEAQGLVERKRSETDKRNYYLGLTPLGFETYTGNLPVFADEVYRIFSTNLTEEEIDMLRTLLDKVLWGEPRD